MIKYALFHNFSHSDCPWGYNVYRTKLHARIARYRICGSNTNTKFLKIELLE